MNLQKFHGKLVAFSEQSMKWCSKEAEVSAEATGNVLSMLLTDATRVSKMSAETLAALDTLKAQLQIASKLVPDERTRSIVGTLKSLSAQHLEIGEFATPIIETLQFQDRIRQNMENLAKMIKIWMLDREMELEPGNLSADAAKAFGERLLKATTMQSERDVVRKFISGLPEEQKSQDVMLF